MLRSVVRPLEFRCLKYGDENLKNSTTKLTELILRKRIYPQISSTDTLDFSTEAEARPTTYSRWLGRKRARLASTTPRPKTLYADFYNKIHDLLYNISAHPADASDMIDRIILSYLSSTKDFPVWRSNLVLSFSMTFLAKSWPSTNKTLWSIPSGYGKKIRTRRYGYAVPVIPVSCFRKDRPNLSPTFDGWVVPLGRMMICPLIPK